MYYYSRAVNGFYSDEFHGSPFLSTPDPTWDGEGDVPMVTVRNPQTSIPEDAVEVSDDTYLGLLGKRFGPNAEGLPIELPPPALTEADQSREVSSRTQRANSQVYALQGRVDAINDAIRFDDATDDERAELPLRTAQLTDWQKYRIALGRVSKAPGWYDNPQWPPTPQPYVVEFSKESQ